mmetsp:Transcript_26510/g.76520  ORF Transcript_26510/g.76520 Transcript_26510/m.76520 type:complete len:667 (-) Transcript_26510:242-2242(-)|eukprot:CAMPEP_0181054420 /NCGR_PEP_ID=MMETSP1070-20121207/18667_1 /TAXON_ID=265543 /ORGANISM="Minutocellus polymorphus, Strain NH13" /LENGTH=666 /DNA_ID=CAMNT_0023133685 /DNA_START=56 /DNA_END=2056 /DNA_ORIENTATION=+
MSPPPSRYLRRHAANPAAINASVHRAVVRDDAALLRRLLDDVGVGHILRHCMMIDPLVTTRPAIENNAENAAGGDDAADKDEKIEQPIPGHGGDEREQDDDDDDDYDSDGDSSGSSGIALGGEGRRDTGSPTLEVILDDSFHGNEGLEMFLGGSPRVNETTGKETKEATRTHTDKGDGGSGADAIVETGKTLFHIAAFYGSHETIHLLSASCKEHFREQIDLKGHHLTDQSSTDAAQSILVSLLSLPTSEGSTALHIATFRGHAQAVNVLIQQGVDPNHPSANGTTAGIIAAARNNVETLNVLFGSSADLNAADADGYGPCHAACVNGCVDALRYLFECTRCNDKDQQPDRVVDLSRITRSGFGCAALAAKHNQADVIEYLSFIHQLDELAPDINQRVMAPDASDSFNLDPPIHIATKHSSVDALRAFLRCSNCDADARDVQGQTALTLAVAECQVDAVRCFAETVSSLGFELLDTEDVTGMTPLYLASKLGYVDIVCILAQISDVKVMCLVEDEEIIIDQEPRSADTSKDEVQDAEATTATVRDELKQGPAVSEGFPMADRTVSQPPLLAAVSHHHVECVRILLERGADVNQTDDKGHSALSIAARHGFLPLAELLISSGANLSLRSYRGGGSALQKARKYKHTKLVELLEKQEMLNNADLEGVV